MEEITILQALSQVRGTALSMVLKMCFQSTIKNPRERSILNIWERPSLRGFIRKRKKSLDMRSINLLYYLFVFL